MIDWLDENLDLVAPPNEQDLGPHLPKDAQQDLGPHLPEDAQLEAALGLQLPEAPQNEAPALDILRPKNAQGSPLAPMHQDDSPLLNAQRSTLAPMQQDGSPVLNPLLENPDPD